MPETDPLHLYLPLREDLFSKTPYPIKRRRPIIYHSCLRSLGIAFLLLITISVWGTIAEAESDMNHLLRGTYALTDTRTCETSTGFGEELELLGWGTFRTYSTNGIVRYNVDGTGYFEGSSLSIIPSANSPGNKPVSKSEYTCDVTYNLDMDRSLTAEATCFVPILSGPSEGETAIVSGIETNSYVSLSSSIINLGAKDPSVETITIPNYYGPGSDYVYKRICTRSGIAIKIAGNDVRHGHYGATFYLNYKGRAHYLALSYYDHYAWCSYLVYCQGRIRPRTG